MIALAALLCTAVLALYAGLAKTFRMANPATMQAMLDVHWTDSEVAARNITAYCNIEALKTLRAGTNFKYRVLWVAGVCQMVAVLALIICVGFAV